MMHGKPFRRLGDASMPSMKNAFPTIPDRFNMADYFLFDRLREGHGQRVAIRTKQGKLTYAEVVQQAQRVGAALSARGLAKGDRVLLSMPDIPEFATSIFGALAAGGVVAMVNPLLPSEDLRHYLAYTGCRFIICDAEVAAKIAPHAEASPALSGVLVVGEAAPAADGFEPFDAAVASASVEDWNPPTTHKDDIAYWLFTSGSTGRPKAAVHRHQDFAWNCERYAKAVLGFTSTDVTLATPRLYFGYATGTNLFFPFSVGATTCLFPEKPTPEVLFENIERFRPTILTNVPTSIGQMVAHPEAETRDLSSLRAVLSAGEALPPELYRRWMDRFGVEILDGIGSAEMFHIFITNAPGNVTPGSLGRLVPGYSARIRGPDGQDVKDDEIGTLWIHGESAALEYHDNPEESAQTFFGQWVKTADLMRRDAQGRFWYVGRGDDVLKVGGMFVSPIEIEDRLLTHPNVAESVIVPYEEDGLTKPLALVILKGEAKPSHALARELAQYSKSGLAAYKYPRRIRFVRELPRNDRGKVERKKIREDVRRHGVADSFETDLRRPETPSSDGRPLRPGR
jgi:benzoate-CoA ligase family protein